MGPMGKLSKKWWGKADPVGGEEAPLRLPTHLGWPNTFGWRPRIYIYIQLIIYYIYYMRIILSNGGEKCFFFHGTLKDFKKSPTKINPKKSAWCFSDSCFFPGDHPKSSLRLKLSEPGKEARPQEMPENRSFIFNHGTLNKP